MQKDCKECGEKIPPNCWDKFEIICGSCSIKMNKCQICGVNDLFPFVTRCRSCLISEHGTCERCDEPVIDGVCTKNADHTT